LSQRPCASLGFDERWLETSRTHSFERQPHSTIPLPLSRASAAVAGPPRAAVPS